eukprot:COSAG05_NODE_1119_length_5816_cov_7.262375_5_plen_258_part_00
MRLTRVVYGGRGARQIIDMIPEIARTMQPLTRVATLLDTIPSIEPHPEHPASELRPSKFEGRIEFKNVDFTYPSEKQKQVLKDLSVVIEPRTKVALVGKAGCGKSTSVTLLQRFYNVNTGSILLDGRPIADYDVHHLRRHIGVVSQDNVLFSNSILENITYGMGQGHLPEPTEADVWAACDAANVTEFVHTFPNGLHTFIGEKVRVRPREIYCDNATLYQCKAAHSLLADQHLPDLTTVLRCAVPRESNCRGGKSRG